MKAAEIRKQSDDELKRLGQDTRKEIFQVHLKKGRGDNAEQPLRVRGLRKDLARVETVMRERGIC